MALDFPSSPTPGQPYTIGGVTWTWDGTKWVAQGTGTGIYLPLTGGTMTGDLILNRDAQVALGAATFEQVNARGAGDNRLVNGDMRIDQRNNGASGTAVAVYTVDRWYYFANQTSKFVWSRGSPGPPLFPYCLVFTAQSSYSLLAGDTFAFYQPIEADMISDFQWGTANAQPVTLSFWGYSSQAGTFSGAIRNGVPNRSYPFSFVLSASVWTKIVITIPGDTGGTWTLSGNAAGLMVGFDLGSGSTFRAPAGAWVNGNIVGANGAVSIVATNSAQFIVTGVKLEVGSVATPYNRQSLAKSMADCQRYYFDAANGSATAAYTVNGYTTAATTVNVGLIYLPTMMRAAPTVNQRNLTGPTVSALSLNPLSPQTISTVLTVTGTGNQTASFNMTASAEL